MISNTHLKYEYMEENPTKCEVTIAVSNLLAVSPTVISFSATYETVRRLANDILIDLAAIERI